MALSNRVWGAGKAMVLVAALGVTYIVFAFGSMRVALRAREVTVPDLQGRSVAEATTQLTSLGLTLRVDDSRRLDPKVPADRILLQDPVQGIVTRRQRSVRVWLSAGPRIATIPRLTGETERTAQLRLQADGLVVAQKPPPDSRGTEVALLVNRGERSTSYVMPDLIGVNGDRAAELLRSRGLRVAVVGEQPYPGVPAGIVLRQLPQAGFQIAPGEPISIEVSR
jgi:beta-lactam-binding protein with PASTA domain